MQIGDTVNLVRKITSDILPVELTRVLTTGTKPAVEVRWKNDRNRYKLDLDKNEVLAIDATQHNRQQMRLWWTISEEHRKALTELFYDMKRKGKRR